MNIGVGSSGTQLWQVLKTGRSEGRGCWGFLTKLYRTWRDFRSRGDWEDAEKDEEAGGDQEEAVQEGRFARWKKSKMKYFTDRYSAGCVGAFPTLGRVCFVNVVAMRDAAQDAGRCMMRVETRARARERHFAHEFAGKQNGSSCSPARVV
eukprot:378144-Rhodomonas_salina.2